MNIYTVDIAPEVATKDVAPEVAQVGIVHPVVSVPIGHPISILNAATGAWRASSLEADELGLVDLSGNDRPMQFGGGTSDPRVLKYGNEPYTYFPGLSGSYANVDDVNVIDANTAHIEQSIGLWEDAFQTAAIVKISSGEPPIIGSFVMRWYQGVADNEEAYLRTSVANADLVPKVTAGIEYTYSVHFHPGISNASQIAVGIVWRDGTGSAISTDLSPFQAINGEWTQYSITATAPANAESVQLLLRPKGLDKSQFVYADAICLREGPDPTFIPSLHIVGDIDLRARVAVDDLTSSDEQTLISRYDSSNNQRSYLLRINTSGFVLLNWSTTGSDAPSAVSTAAIPVDDGEEVLIQAVLDVNNGGVYEVKFYTSTDDLTWTQLGDTVVGDSTTSIFAGSASVEYGSFNTGTLDTLSGKFYKAEIRDGIDGLVVLDADLTDRALADSPFTTETDTGHTLELNDRASLITSTRLFLDGVDDYLSVADDPAFAIEADEHLTVVAVCRTIDTASMTLMQHRDSSNGEGWRMSMGFSEHLAAIKDTAGDPASARAGGPASHDGSINTWAMIIDRTVDELTVTMEVDTDTVSSATIDEMNSSTALTLGAHGELSNFWNGEVLGAAVFVDRVLTTDEIEQVARELQGIGA